MAQEYHQQTLSGLRVAKDYWTPKEVAELYHVTPQTVCNWCRLGILKADKRETVSKGAKGNRHRWHIFPEAIEDVESHREELIELTRRYWMQMYAKKIRKS